MLTEAEALRDVAVRATCCGELHDLDLALAQPCAPAMLRYKPSTAT